MSHLVFWYCKILPTGVKIKYQILLILGFLRHIGDSDVLYKPLQSGSKGVREVSFYDALYNVSTHIGDPSIFPSLCRSSNNSLLKSILPKYYGLTTITDRAGQKCMHAWHLWLSCPVYDKGYNSLGNLHRLRRLLYPWYDYLTHSLLLLLIDTLSSIFSLYGIWNPLDHWYLWYNYHSLVISDFIRGLSNTGRYHQQVYSSLYPWSKNWPKSMGRQCPSW